MRRNDLMVQREGERKRESVKSFQAHTTTTVIAIIIIIIIETTALVMILNRCRWYS